MTRSLSRALLGALLLPTLPAVAQTPGDAGIAVIDAGTLPPEAAADAGLPRVDGGVTSAAPSLPPSRPPTLRTHFQVKGELLALRGLPHGAGEPERWAVLTPGAVHLVDDAGKVLAQRPLVGLPAAQPPCRLARGWLAIESAGSTLRLGWATTLHARGEWLSVEPSALKPQGLLEGVPVEWEGGVFVAKRLPGRPELEPVLKRGTTVVELPWSPTFLIGPAPSGGPALAIQAGGRAQLLDARGKPEGEPWSELGLAMPVGTSLWATAPESRPTEDRIRSFSLATRAPEASWGPVAGAIAVLGRSGRGSPVFGIRQADGTFAVATLEEVAP